MWLGLFRWVRARILNPTRSVNACKNNTLAATYLLTYSAAHSEALIPIPYFASLFVSPSLFLSLSRLIVSRFALLSLSVHMPRPSCTVRDRRTVVLSTHTVYRLLVCHREWKPPKRELQGRDEKEAVYCSLSNRSQ